MCYVIYRKHVVCKYVQYATVCMGVTNPLQTFTNHYAHPSSIPLGAGLWHNVVNMVW